MAACDEKLLHTLENLTTEQMKKFKWYLTLQVLDSFDPIPTAKSENADRLDTVNLMVQKYRHDGALKISLEILRRMDQNNLVEQLEKKTALASCGDPLSQGEYAEYKHKHQLQLKSKYQKQCDGMPKHGKKTHLKKICTEHYITEAGISKEHEVIQIETTARKSASPEESIACNAIFTPASGKNIRTVLTKGIAGIGKTVSVEQFLQDWAEGKANEDIDFIFQLPFQRLNMLDQGKHNLINVVHECCEKIEKRFLNHIFTTMKKPDKSEFRVLFVLDGLDEFQVSLNYETKSCEDVTEPTSIDVLLTNLITRNLLPSALLWITSRPEVANKIPSHLLDLVTEVRGFTDKQKEEYFREACEENQAMRIIKHIRASSSLFIMCHVPVFCQIIASILEKNSGEVMPKALTQIYTLFLVRQLKTKNAKYLRKQEADSAWDEENIKMVQSLGKLAFEQLEDGQHSFDKQHLRACDIDVSEAAKDLGVVTEIFKEDEGVYVDKVYCFMHLTIQELFAALHVFLSFNNDGVDLMAQQSPIKRKMTSLFNPQPQPAITFYKNAVDKALHSKTGHLDLFLRFLLGLSLESNQNRLRGLLKRRRSSSQTHEETVQDIQKKTVQYIKKKIEKNPSSERCVNLFYCLNELNDHTLEIEMQRSLNSGSVSMEDLSPAHWSALVFVLLTSEEKLAVFELKKYSRSEKGLLKLLPVVKASRSALLNHCNLSQNCCESLASALNSSNLREVDLSDNDLQDSGVKKLSDELESPHSKLETLRLNRCHLSQLCCEALASALNSSNLRQLDLSDNDLQDSGVKKLSAGLGNPHCKLETLRLNRCHLSQLCCEALASALNSSNLRQLDLNDNDLQDSGVKKLSAGLGNPRCKLETLRLNRCHLSHLCCEALASALNSNLRQLDLSDNDLQDSGVKKISAGLGNPHCKLEILRLSGCLVTKQGCVSLASAMRSNPSHLRELDLSFNHPGDSGVKLFPAELKKLNVDHGGKLRIRPGLRKYACDLTLDPNTANRYLSLSEENRTVTRRWEEQPYPVHPDRFEDCFQVLCGEGLSGRCYWETEWRGRVYIAVTYKGISRGRVGRDFWLGHNDRSWSLRCDKDRYYAWHNDMRTDLPVLSSSSSRVGVYLDRPAGTLSFYTVSSDTLTHLHTFTTTFTEPLYAGFGFYNYGSSVSLCKLE